jgi:hypothetical protein
MTDLCPFNSADCPTPLTPDCIKMLYSANCNSKKEILDQVVDVYQFGETDIEFDLTAHMI